MADLLPIPADALPQMVGKGVHVQGWPAGCIFVLDRIEGAAMHLRTPSSGRRYTVAANRALYTRKHQPEGAQ